MSNVGRMQSASFAGMCRAVSSKILDEGKAYRACDIDVMSHNGFNFPGYPGGLMYGLTRSAGATEVSCQIQAWHQQQRALRPLRSPAPAGRNRHRVPRRQTFSQV